MERHGKGCLRTLIAGKRGLSATIQRRVPTETIPMLSRAPARLEQDKEEFAENRRTELREAGLFAEDAAPRKHLLPETASVIATPVMSPGTSFRRG